MNVIGKYKNGNYTVTILGNGTKIRENDLDFFAPEKPESMDIKITNCCEMACPFCHENSTSDGKHGDILNIPFLDSLLPYTELAIGGGNPIDHPDILQFLLELKKRKLIPNMTVNQHHFLKYKDDLKKLCDNELIYGLGISLTDPNDEFIEAIKEFPNAVIHVINGVHTIGQLERLKDLNLKILILGYKEFRRGKTLYENFASRVSIEGNKDLLHAHLPEIIAYNWFDVVSFDNLAIKQLDVKRLLSEEKWNEFYMGDDGMFTMYVDMVNREFAKSSTSTERWPITNDIKEMFEKVKNN